MLPTVSVVIPAHNEERTLQHVLEAVCRQDYPREKLEVIVIDDCSTDGTPEAAKKFPVKYIRNSSNLGLAGSLNVGIENSSGEIVVTLHADCVPLSTGWIRRLVKHFEDPRIGAVTSHLVADLDRMSKLNRYFCFVYVAGCHHSSKIPRLCKPSYEARFVGNKCDAYRREVLRRVGGFDTIFSVANEDNDVSEKIRRAGYKMVTDSEAKVRHMLSSHQDSLKAHMKKAICYSLPQVILFSRYGYFVGSDRILSILLILLGIFAASISSLLPGKWIMGILAMEYAMVVAVSLLFMSRRIPHFRVDVRETRLKVGKAMGYLLTSLLLLIFLRSLMSLESALLLLPALLGLVWILVNASIKGYTYFQRLQDFKGALTLVLLSSIWYLLYGVGFLKGVGMYLLRKKRF